MPNVQIKNVPADAHAVLTRRAAAAHQSLQEYLLTRLVTEASQPTVTEVLARVGDRDAATLSLADAAAALRAERAGR